MTLLKKFQEEQDKEFDKKYHYQDGVQLLLKSPNHFQTYDVTAGVKSYIHSREEALCEKIAADLARILPVGEVNALDIIRAVEKYRQELLCQ